MTAPSFVDCRCDHDRVAHEGPMAPQCTADGCTCIQYRPVAPSKQGGPAAGMVYAVPIGELHPSASNPRSVLGSVDELAASIRRRGLLQPLLATKRPAGGLSLIAGHRRLAAAKQVGMETVPVIVLGPRLAADQLTVAVVENLQRVQLAPMDEARACKALLDHGRSRSDIAFELSRSANWVADRLALLALPRELQRKVDAGTLTIGKATKLGHQLARHGSGSVTTSERAPNHFTKRHDLAPVAAARCDAAGHPVPGRIGPACGRCWEQTIRQDEQRLYRSKAS